jgi:glycine dehydrogenase subunit 2
MGFDVTTDMMGTCTMKYSPRVHEHIARQPDLAEVHPGQPEATQQGVLEILYRFDRMMCAIAGMDAFSFQPASGAQGIYTNACIIRAYHAARGEADRRDVGRAWQRRCTLRKSVHRTGGQIPVTHRCADWIR